MTVEGIGGVLGDRNCVLSCHYYMPYPAVEVTTGRKELKASWQSIRPYVEALMHQPPCKVD
jgi:hypothetical protein